MLDGSRSRCWAGLFWVGLLVFEVLGLRIRHEANVGASSFGNSFAKILFPASNLSAPVGRD